MPYGWTQSLKNWTITKDKEDTIITYSFTKQEFTNLRVYIVGLERYPELYRVEKEQSSLKDSVIQNISNQVINRDSIIVSNKKMINFQSTELTKSDKWGQQQEALKIKYQKRAAKLPHAVGLGSIIGFILCLLLVK